MLLQSGELWCTKFVFKLLCIVPIQLAPSSSLSAWLVKLYMCASIQCQYQYGYLQACYVLEDLWLFLVLLVCSTESREETAGCLRRAADNWWISNPRKLGSMPGGGARLAEAPQFLRFILSNNIAVHRFLYPNICIYALNNIPAPHSFKLSCAPAL